MEEQVKMAIEARKNAYAPYSNYLVGACLKTKTGKMYAGCNIENNGIQSICAERVAFCKAISEGERDFESIVIVGGKTEALDFAHPCGYCRQFIQEFVDESFKIIVYKTDSEINTYSINDLLPNRFSL